MNRFPFPSVTTLLMVAVTFTIAVLGQGQGDRRQRPVRNHLPAHPACGHRRGRGRRHLHAGDGLRARRERLHRHRRPRGQRRDREPCHRDVHTGQLGHAQDRARHRSPRRYTDEELDAFASNSDYSGIPASLTFNPGDTEKTFTATHDTVDDDDESVKLSFGALPQQVSDGTTVEATVNITDDAPEVTVSFEMSSYTVAESDDTSTMDEEEHKVSVKVVLSADPERTVTIPTTAVVRWTLLPA